MSSNLIYPNQKHINNQPIYYIYAYLRSKDSKTAKAGTPYYIGKGFGKRAYQPHRKLNLPKNKNLIVIMESGLTELGAFTLERRLIKLFGRKDLNSGILLNKTDGGPGSPRCIALLNTKKSLIHKQNISKSKKGKKIHTAESKKKLSDAAKGINNPMHKKGGHSAETKLKMKKPKSAAHKISIKNTHWCKNIELKQTICNTITLHRRKLSINQYREIISLRDNNFSPKYIIDLFFTKYQIILLKSSISTIYNRDRYKYE